MWIGSEVDALVAYTRGVTYPAVRAIRWDRRRIDLRGTVSVDRATTSLNYVCTDGLTRYRIRFEPHRQAWYLDAIDDAGLVEPDDVPLCSDGFAAPGG